MEFFVRISGKTFKVELQPGVAAARIDGRPIAFFAARDPGGPMRIRIGPKTFAFETDLAAPGEVLRHRGRPLAFEISSQPISGNAKCGTRNAGRSGEETLRAHMPGLLVSLHVREGQEVATGTLLAVIEAMKMQNEIRAKRKGKVSQLFVSAGATLEAGQPILTII